LEHRGEATCVLAAVATFNSAVVSAAICVTFAAAITATAASASIVSAAIDAAAAAAFAAARVCAAESDASPLWNVLLKDHRVVLRTTSYITTVQYEPGVLTASQQCSMNRESLLHHNSAV